MCYELCYVLLQMERTHKIAIPRIWTVPDQFLNNIVQMSVHEEIENVDYTKMTIGSISKINNFSLLRDLITYFSRQLFQLFYLY